MALSLVHLFLDLEPTCDPSWHKEGQACPYGEYITDSWWYSSFTHPGVPGALDYVAMFHSASLFPLWWAAALIHLLPAVMLKHRYLRLAFIYGLYSGTGVAIGLMRAYMLQPRPVGSCTVSCGMPSGHSALALSLFTYLAAKLYGARPFRSVSLGEILTFATLALLLPIPWSRVQLRDHTLEQMLAGSALGIACGQLAHFCEAGVILILMKYKEDELETLVGRRV